MDKELHENIKQTVAAYFSEDEYTPEVRKLAELACIEVALEMKANPPAC